MLRSRFELSCCTSWVLAVVGLLSANAGFSMPPDPPDVGGATRETPEDFGCGRAKAARMRARHILARDLDRSSLAYLEAMGDTDVLHYELDLETTDLDTVSHTCTVTGSNRMTIRSKVSELANFTFQLHGNYTITGALVNDTVPVVVDSSGEPARAVSLDRTYVLDETFTLTIAYTGTSVSNGFGSIEVWDRAGSPVVSTLSEPYYANTWWPAKDGAEGVAGDNSDKATIDISVTVPDDLAVVSNGLLQSVEALSGARSKHNWSSSYPIATYLVAFSAANYTVWVEDYAHDNGVMPVEFYIYPGWDTPTNRAAWENVIGMMGVLAPFYGEYPFIDEKYAIYNFEFGGGMEHQTASGQTGFSENLTVHELAHQWWGDMITCKTWSDIWLNEGFAEYSECLWAEFKNGAADPEAYYDAIIARKPSSASGTVYVYPDELEDFRRIFDVNLSYRKGAWVLHQLRHVVGDKTFFDTLAAYRAAFEFSAATTDDFVAVASATYGEDLTWFFDQWVYQSGAPSYEYGWDTVEVGGQDYLHVKIRQTQFFPNLSVFTMPIDLVVTVDGADETVTVWNDVRLQWFVTPLDGVPTALQFDPHEWVLKTFLSRERFELGDLDDDKDVDDDDFVLFESCYTASGGELEVGCEPVDFDGDLDVDCTDWAQFTLAWTAEGAAPSFAQCPAVSVPVVSGGGMVTMIAAFFVALALVSRRNRSGDRAFSPAGHAR